MRINQNAQYMNHEFDSNPTVDTRIHNIEKLAGFRLPDLQSPERGKESMEKTNRVFPAAGSVAPSMRSYLHDSIENDALRKQQTTMEEVAKRQDSMLNSTVDKRGGNDDFAVSMGRIKEGRSRQIPNT